MTVLHTLILVFGIVLLLSIREGLNLITVLLSLPH